MSGDLKDWKARPRPERRVFEGHYVRLEPLDAMRHGDGLLAVSSTSEVADAEQRFRWLPDYPPETRAGFDQWLQKTQASEDPLCSVVIDKANGRVGGRQTLMRIDEANGVIEIGNIYWGPGIAGTRLATEALYLFAKYVFDALGYRRFEWKCDNANEPSKRAALRFGFRFEGIFRQHKIVKGLNRDTAWYAMTDGDWPAIRKALEAWIDPANFDGNGRQKTRLEELRGQVQV